MALVYDNPVTMQRECWSNMLEDEKRVLVHRAMVSALGMKYGTTNRGADRLQVFVNADRIKPFVSSNLLMLIDSPLKFRA